MGFKDKLRLGQDQILSGAQRLQNYWESVSKSLTSIEQALNHNTAQVGGYLQGLGEDLQKIKDKLGIEEGEQDETKE